ncbi:fibroleukin [Drosophila ananassae]|uniref:fibroleukin n=1 Tax=Drosophila ananassae TaxID=7217 RepID=UPI001CFF7D9E|nr:fibroleukin [Drosophila ananassae]XP_044571880.1 fibroleukin [Drosophila ananassae]
MHLRVIAAVLSVLVLSDLTAGDEECYKNTAPEEVVEVVECSGSCFEIVKPILNHFVEMKMAADNSRYLKDQLKDVINENKIKDEQINALIKSSNEQKNTINTLTKNNDALIKAQSGNEELIRVIKSEISQKNNEINSFKTQICEDLKKASEDKDNFNIKLLSCSNNINKNKNSLMDKNVGEIQEKTDQAMSKESQNKDPTSQINVLSQNLTETIEKLGKYDEITSCPTASKGLFHIKHPEVSAFEAPCNGSGWMVIQRRMDGNVDFDRNWTEYRDGFGNLRGEFFLGLEKVHLITQSRQHELLIRLGKVNGSTDFVQYDNFRIGSEKDSYPLESVGNSTARDSLTYYHLK